jgi:CubicO group peptidase (beta-lactamase class C family)
MRILVLAMVASLTLLLGRGADARDRVAENTDAYFRALADAGQFSGVVLITNDDHIRFERAYGSTAHRGRAPIRPDAVFPLASLSKAFTAAAIVKLAGEGRLGFDDRLSRFLPDFPNGGAITIDQLLRHTSGVGQLDDPTWFLSPHPLADYVRGIAAARPLFAPGKGDEYSNEGYILLAAVVEQITHQPFERYVGRELTGPLALRSVGADRPHGRRPKGSRASLSRRPIPLQWDESPLPGASGLQGSARDVAAFARAVRSGRFGDYRTLRYPYGWGRRTYEGRSLLEQSGSVEGFGSYMAVYDDGTSVAVLSNIQSGVQSRWGEDVARLLAGGRPKIAQLPRAIPLLHGEQLASTYESPEGGYTLRLRLRSGQLEMTYGNYPFWRPVFGIGKDRLMAPADFTYLRVERAPSGTASAVMFLGPDGSEQGASRWPRRR